MARGPARLVVSRASFSETGVLATNIRSDVHLTESVRVSEAGADPRFAGALSFGGFKGKPRGKPTHSSGSNLEKIQGASNYLEFVVGPPVARH